MPKNIQSALFRLTSSLRTKQDVLYGKLGRYDSSGNQAVEVPNRAGFVWVRVNGQESEPIQAYNAGVPIKWADPVILERDPLVPSYYKVISKNTNMYSDWPSGMVLPHAAQHSFGLDASSGRDVVWIYRRQMAQPLLCHPQITPNMTVYVEPDYYYWGGAFSYFSGGSSADLTGSKPAAGLAKFVTVYIDGALGVLATSDGSAFDIDIPPASASGSISAIDLLDGIPLAAVYLTDATTVINWNDMVDLRVLLSPGGISNDVDSTDEEIWLFGR